MTVVITAAEPAARRLCWTVALFRVTVLHVFMQFLAGLAATAQVFGVPLAQRRRLGALDVEISRSLLTYLFCGIGHLWTGLLVAQHVAFRGIFDLLDLICGTDKGIAVPVLVNAILSGPEGLLGGIAILEIFQLRAEQLLISFHHDDVMGCMVLGERGIGKSYR
ncbi:hypothetical protein ACPA9J_08870 [Pseudomonas aeruginosa]